MADFTSNQLLILTNAKVFCSSPMRPDPIIVSSSGENDSLFTRVEVNLLDSCFILVDNSLNPSYLLRWIKFLFKLMPVSTTPISWFAFLSIAQLKAKCRITLIENLCKFKISEFVYTFFSNRFHVWNLNSTFYEFTFFLRNDLLAPDNGIVYLWLEIDRLLFTDFSSLL